MKTICYFFILFILQGAIGGIVRKPPAFSTPMYSDSYLPAAMQVIFHAVEQLKLLESEENAQNNTTVSSSSSVSPMPLSQSVETQRTTDAVQVTTPSVTSAQKPDEEENKKEKEEPPKRETNDKIATKPKNPENISETSLITVNPSEHHRDFVEVNEETAETNYATLEANYESPEYVYGTEEANEEIPEENQEEISLPFDVETDASITESDIQIIAESENGSTLQPGLYVSVKDDEEEEEKKEPTIESVVEGIYEIVKSTPSTMLEDSDKIFNESKSSTGVSIGALGSTEEEVEEMRFTLVEKKVTQVPRPSLSSHLRHSKVPPSVSLRQLADLYDALSKDARKQGFSKYTGYSDEVLKTLRTSAEGGIAPQLKTILKKVVDRNELTREDAKTRAHRTLRDLGDPSSDLSKALARLLPLRYSP